MAESGVQFKFVPNPVSTEGREKINSADLTTTTTTTTKRQSSRAHAKSSKYGSEYNWEQKVTIVKNKSKVTKKYKPNVKLALTALSLKIGALAMKFFGNGVAKIVDLPRYLKQKVSFCVLFIILGEFTV